MQSESQTKRHEVIEAARLDRATNRYLFTALSKSEKPEKWLSDLREAGFFEANNLPGIKVSWEKGNKLYSSEFWPAFWYLENLSKRNLVIEDDSISDFLLSLIASINNQQNRIKKEQGFRNFNTDRSLLIILAYVPLAHLKPENLNDISEIVDSDTGGTAAEIKDKLAPYIFKSDRPDLIRALLSQILKYSVRERKNYFGGGTYKEIDSILTDYWFKEVIKDSRAILIEKYPQITQEISQHIIELILADDNRQFSWYIIKTIEDNREHRYPNVRDYEYILSDLLRDSILKLPQSEKKTIIESYIKHTHEYFIRLAIHLIGNDYEQFQDIFWSHFSTKNPITDEELRWPLHHEIFEFVKTNAAILSDEAIQKLVTWIEDLENDKFTGDAKARGADWLKKRIAYNKLEWYKEALQKSPNPKIQEKRQENEAICDWERAIPAGHFSGPIGPATVVHDETPKDSDELSKMSIPEVAAYLKEFGLVDDHHHEKPNSSGLARELEIDVKNRSQEYSAQISEFTVVPHYYLQRIFWALQSSWRDGKPLEWQHILDFIEYKVAPLEFWQKIVIEERQINEQTALAVAMIGLINDGLNDRDNKFPIELLMQTQAIILNYIEKFPFSTDLSALSINDYINTAPGKVFEAAIKAWWAIENEIKKSNKLDNRILPEYEKRFTTENSPSEFYYSLGQGFRGFWYYNREWTVENIENIFSATDSKKLVLSFNGFFETVPAVYTDIYDYFKKEGLFNKAISQVKSLDEHAREILAHQILLGGIESGENLKDQDSEIKRLIENSDSHTLSRLCWLFWHYISEGNSKVYPYMVEAWQLINERLNAIPESEKGNVTSYLLRWPELIDAWNADVPRLIENTMAHLPRQRSVDYIIEAYHKHYNHAKELVIESFKSILNKKHFPTYPTDKLMALIETMYTDGHKIDADLIYGAYSEAGIYYLRPIWEKYNTASKT